MSMKAQVWAGDSPPVSDWLLDSKKFPSYVPTSPVHFPGRYDELDAFFADGAQGLCSEQESEQESQGADQAYRPPEISSPGCSHRTRPRTLGNRDVDSEAVAAADAASLAVSVAPGLLSVRRCADARLLVFIGRTVFGGGSQNMCYDHIRIVKCLLQHLFYMCVSRVVRQQSSDLATVGYFVFCFFVNFDSGNTSNASGNPALSSNLMTAYLAAY